MSVWNERPFCLPVSGRVISIRRLSGAEELLLAEASGGETELAVELAKRLARDTEGGQLDWRAMAVTDLDAFIVFLRGTLIGDRIRTDVACMAPHCGERLDIDFGLRQYLEYHKPSAPGGLPRGWSVQPGEERGWFRLAPREKDESSSSGEGICFRLPTPNDQLAVHGLTDADAELARRCLQPAAVPATLRRKAEAAMEAMAPCLSRHVRAACPECGLEMSFYFEPRGFCLRELRERASSIYEEVDILARSYHWTENRILSLPRARRVAYVELARGAQSN